MVTVFGSSLTGTFHRALNTSCRYTCKRHIFKNCINHRKVKFCKLSAHFLKKMWSWHRS